MHDYEVFAAAAGSPSFSAAARQLSVPPSSVLRRVEALERRMGVNLFVRTTRQLRLTEAGRAFQASVTKILRDIEAAEQTATSFATAPRGTLRIETRVAMGARLLAPLLPGFMRAYPEIKVDLRLSDEIGSTMRDGVDVAIRLELGEDSSLMSRKVARSQRLTFASPDYLARAGSPATPDDLARHNCLTYSLNGQPAVWTFRSKDYHRAIAVPGSFSTNSVASICTAAVAGIGVAVQHHWAVSEEVASGRLVRILAEYEVTTMSSFDTPIYAVYHRHSQHSPKLRVFLDHLQAAMQPRQLPIRP